ncbi:MAG: hypothetical protein R3C03_22640 [Pirellulaceae bacterium]
MTILGEVIVLPVKQGSTSAIFCFVNSMDEISVMRITGSVVKYLYSLLVIGCLCSEAFGQQTIQIQSGVVRASTIQAAKVVSAQDSNEPATPTTTVPDAAGAKQAIAAPETPAQQKIKMLMELSYQRTPESILKAWSANDDSDQDAEKAKAEEVGVEGNVVSAYKDLIVFELKNQIDCKASDVVSIANGESNRWDATVVENSETTVVVRLKNSEAENDKAQDESKPAAGKEQKSDPANEGDTDSEKESGEPKSNEQSETATDNAESQTDAPKLNVGDTCQLIKKTESGEASEAAAIKKSVDQFSMAVTLGEWADVKTFLAELDIEDADKLYAKMLADLAQSVTPPARDLPAEVQAQLEQLAQMRPVNQQAVPSYLSPEDILQLSEASPKLIRAEMEQAIVSSIELPADLISGTWVLTPEIPGMPDVPDEAKMILELRRKGDQVSGTAKVNEQSMEFTGSFNEETGELRLVGDANGIEAKLEGNVDGNKMTLSASNDSTGTATRVVGILREAAVVASASHDKASTGESDVSAESNDTKTNKTADHTDAIANLIRLSKQSGHDFREFVEKLKQGTTHFGLTDIEQQLTTSKLLLRAGLTDDTESFLPEFDAAETQANILAMKLWAEFADSKFKQRRIGEWLETAWNANQQILGNSQTNSADQDTSLNKLLELAPLVEKELGQSWMQESFTSDPERGMKILTSFGTRMASMTQQSQSVAESTRFQLLDLQNRTVEQLLNVAPDLAAEWRMAMSLLLRNWISEANLSLQYSNEGSRGTYMQIDMYGNYYWVTEDQFRSRYSYSQQPRPIKIGDVLSVSPSLGWKNLVDKSLLPEVDNVSARLHLKINEEDKAFPFIESLAADHPTTARDLVHEFFTTWAQTHDPNSENRRRNPYVYVYGYDQKAEAIPLTRSKQERNLRELAGWVQRVRAMNLPDVDESRIAQAFTTCHSSAEVFQMDSIQSVLGDINSLKPETIADLCQAMRNNLAGQWRKIREQEDKKTNRREPEVQAEVRRGYSVAIALAQDSLKSEPDDWRLNLALASLLFDENAWEQTVQKSSEFSNRRDQAFERFRLAAAKYTDVVARLEESEQSTDVFDYWFYAALGAVDLGQLSDKTTPDLRQYAVIRESIEALPGPAADYHMEKFANNLFTRMSPIKPEMKFRYLRGGFEIVGDHPRAWEAKGLYDYYQDLVSEIKLDVAIDGDDRVGQDQTFGLYVSILHTNEIERESGGFGKYVQNQNSMTFAYNYGRPTEDYRDKFNDAIDQALSEHFEVLNVTFESPDTMQSRPADQLGWRRTPYAYVLLKPKGAEVDRIAPLKLDLDFLDTSGYVVIPIESPELVIDASSKSSIRRPASDIAVTQTLDERQAAEGKLIVEVTATASGLVPDLSELIDVKRDGFEVVSVDDQGVLPSRFDSKSDEIQILSDRSWTIQYQPMDGTVAPTEFVFSNSQDAEATMRFQRYEDADMVEATQVVQLVESYKGTNSYAWLYWLVPVLGIVLAAVFGAMVARKPVEQAQKRFVVPEDINPFSVLSLLKSIKENNGISQAQSADLQKVISQIEHEYFASQDDSDSRDLNPDQLQNVAREWVLLADRN